MLSHFAKWMNELLNLLHFSQPLNLNISFEWLRGGISLNIHIFFYEHTDLKYAGCEICHLKCFEIQNIYFNDKKFNTFGIFLGIRTELI